LNFPRLIWSSDLLQIYLVDKPLFEGGVYDINSI
jgi:hypothetical protein